MKLYSYRYRGRTFGVARGTKLCPAAHCGDAAAYDSLLSLIISGDQAAMAALRRRPNVRTARFRWRIRSTGADSAPLPGYFMFRV